MRGVRLSGDCPRCGSEIVVRRRRADGERFVSCVDYPRCRWAGDYDARLDELADEIKHLRREARSGAGLDADRELRRLITLAHPDRWHGRPATELAHEITIALVALRERLP